MNIIAQGNIKALRFSNAYQLILKSTHGNIIVDGYQGEKCSLCTQEGNIFLNSAIVAKKIRAIITEKGVNIKKIVPFAVFPI